MRKYQLNESFFDIWSSEMAYVLGFWFADGCMRKEKSYRIAFDTNDRALLNKIKRVMNSTHPIYNDQRSKALRLTIYSKRLFQRLAFLGGMIRKSKDMKFPQIPPKFLPDFIRGFFDGDGSVFYVNYIATKNKRHQRELRSNFTSGNRKFLDDLQNILVNNLKVARKKICSYNDQASWKLGYGTKDTIKLLQFMYYTDNPISLERKSVFASQCAKV